MGKGNAESVEKHALQAAFLEFLVEAEISVLVVPCDGKAEMGQVNADLMGTPGFEFGFQQAEILEFLL